MAFEKVNIIVAFLGAISAILAILLMMFYRFLDQRRKLSVEPVYQAEIIQSGSNVSVNGMVVSIYALNIGSQHLYIHSPCIKLPRKINGFDLHQIVTPDEKFPIKLESGQEYSKKNSLIQIIELLRDELGLKPNEKIKFQITDTFNRVHSSKSIKLSHLVEQYNRIRA